MHHLNSKPKIFRWKYSHSNEFIKLMKNLASVPIYFNYIYNLIVYMSI